MLWFCEKLVDAHRKSALKPLQSKVRQWDGESYNCSVVKRLQLCLRCSYFWYLWWQFLYFTFFLCTLWITAALKPQKTTDEETLFLFTFVVLTAVTTANQTHEQSQQDKEFKVNNHSKINKYMYNNSAFQASQGYWGNLHCSRTFLQHAPQMIDLIYWFGSSLCNGLKIIVALALVSRC